MNHGPFCWGKTVSEYSWMLTPDKCMFSIAIEFSLLACKRLAELFFLCFLFPDGDDTSNQVDHAARQAVPNERTPLLAGNDRQSTDKEN